MTDNVAFVTILASALLSGLLGVLISNWYHNRNEKRMEKFVIFRQLIGNRHDLRGDAFTEALNSVFIVFHESKEVKQALKEFHVVITNPTRNLEANQKLLELFKAMSKNLNIATEPLTDDFFFTPFNVRN